MFLACFFHSVTVQLVVLRCLFHITYFIFPATWLTGVGENEKEEVKEGREANDCTGG